MLLTLLSIVMIIVLSGYVVLNTYRRKDRVKGMPGMMIAMSIGMMSSLALGFQLGIVFDHDLAVPSIIAILFGLGIGYFTGKPISVLASLDGMLAGIMGGMMGAMLGSMLGFTYIMALFIDIVFILIFCVVLQLTSLDAVKTNKTKSSGISIPFIAGIITVAFGTVSVGLLLFNQYHDNRTSVVSSQSNEHSSNQENTDYQVISVDVKSNGFSQENIVVKAGVPTKINFIKKTGYTCIKSVESTDLDIDVYLEKGDNYITLDDLKPGTYHFNCGMYMYYGTITVV
ncbi:MULTISPECIES: cupredoxin domain-containing protein [Paenibacillus]|uniref:Cupredoxin domain-containing protein n=2 Tax=Paenibacillus TaxID=44249 RepID=A0A7Y6ERG0_9BACL|nr:MULTISPECIES: cupredoxin domain-containing protein [Paenibacillus]MDN4603798.1 cupredoxin domain-containing protein [Paenibacillus vandeheii]NUU73867.1 cupredoxin domain-containing protein [Paenibacillus xylanilyticus]